MSLILYNDKQAPISADEADANFVFLESQKSTMPTLTIVGGIDIYVVGATVDFNISNYDANTHYLVNLPTNISIDGSGNFSAIPIGDGFNLFALEAGKVPSMKSVALLEHEEFAKDKAPDSIQYGVIDGINALASDNGLSNTVHWLQQDWESIYLSFVLRWTIEKSQYYLDTLSSNSRIVFGWEETLLPPTIWVVDDVNDTSTVYDATALVSTLDASILDILGDASCVDLWSFESASVYNNHDSTNNFVPTATGSFLLGTGKYGGSARPYQYIGAGAITAGNIPFSGDAPATISVWVKHTNANSSEAGSRLVVGTDATRYNAEIEIKSTGSALSITVHIHKRAFTLSIGTYPLNKMVNVMIEYTTGLWEFFVDNISKGTYSLTANWNNSKFTELVVSESYSGSYVYGASGNWDSLRYFNKALNATERQAVVDAGVRYLDLVPPLVGTPVHIVYGTPPSEIKLNGVTEVSGVTLETDGATSNTYKYEKTVVDTNALFDIEATFLNGETGYNTNITGYLTYTRPKNK